MEKYDIIAKGLKKTYQVGENKIKAVNNTSFVIHQGELVAIMGVSGSGKSTLLHILSGLDSADEGTVSYAGQEIGSMTDAQRADFRGKHIGYVYQNFNLLPELTAKENILLPTYITGTKVDKEFFSDLTERLGIVEYLDHYPGQLSGGQQQRVAIARAVINSPEVILCDEPTGALDSGTSEEMMKLFHELNGEGQTIIIVTHDQRIADNCDYVLHIRDGKIA
jgi:putative ABC transport system ATP-binding protein